jgi:hypothetical protein
MRSSMSATPARPGGARRRGPAEGEDVGQRRRAAVGGEEADQEEQLRDGFRQRLPAVATTTARSSPCGAPRGPPP